ncbi:MAG: methylated-DNA--[protein]-cysteine S-methyltransferase, partial [Candidatus Latescibacteria bacterium]|nr:methylated-DNA--[protein]-cysteine S-methyltransferase [bacterium]MBD3424863.1 methylated-DNA--[protein]-cysteine S-methyltransferase [Candidatus Latescibacterota bacterium]
GYQHLSVAIRQLREYFEAVRTEFSLNLNPAGTRFQREVWNQLRRIPYGSKVSYGSIATRMGKPGAARAVGRANATNPIAIVVPCHRVIGADGSMTGYASGIYRKRYLLKLEGAING